MDCGHIAGEAQTDAAHSGGLHGRHWPVDTGWMQGDVNYMKGSGKGYGKSFGGQIYRRMYGTTEEAKEETKEKANDDSLASVIIVSTGDIPRDSAPRKGKEQIREQGKKNNSRAHATYVGSSDTSQPTAGPQEKGKGSKGGAYAMEWEEEEEEEGERAACVEEDCGWEGSVPEN